jgi:superfamily II DNA helicase RecQ
VAGALEDRERRVDRHVVADVRACGELARRAAAEQRKLRRVVDFAYHKGCLRAYILRYFGDRRAELTCGTCSGCTGEAAPGRASGGRDEGTLRVRGARGSSELDSFIIDSAPTGAALREHLRNASRERERQSEREIHTDRKPEELGPARVALEGEPLTIARKVLSCVARTKGRFGKTVVAGVLRGSKAKQILETGLDRLSTYGILADMTQDEIVAWCDALLDADLLALTPGAYPTLQLTPEGVAAMKGEGEARVAVEQFGLAMPIATAPKRASRGETERTVEVTFALFRAGLSIDEIAERRSLVPITVENHVAELVERGTIDVVPTLVDEERYEAIARAAREHGLERLKPIHEALGGKCPYRAIRFVVADLKAKEQP